MILFKIKLFYNKNKNQKQLFFTTPSKFLSYFKLIVIIIHNHKNFKIIKK